MTASPIGLGLRLRFRKAINSGSRNYAAFTTDFDETLEAGDLAAMYAALPQEEKSSLEIAFTEFEQTFSRERVALAEEVSKLIRDLCSSIPSEERSRTAVSLLIDHSGSMKGIRMLSALLAVGTVADAMNNAGISHEVLGFTTTSWHGGNSRKAWRWAGRPKNPGRLCDLRHIVYRSASSPQYFPWYLRMALHPKLLRENIDGEALCWAASRLSAADWDQRIILMISDGCPVDDATILANDDDCLLSSHLKETQDRLSANGYIVGTLLIGDEVIPKTELIEKANEPLSAGQGLLKLLRRSLISSSC